MNTTAYADLKNLVMECVCEALGQVTGLPTMSWGNFTTQAIGAHVGVYIADNPNGAGWFKGRNPVDEDGNPTTNLVGREEDRIACMGDVIALIDAIDTSGGTGTSVNVLSALLASLADTANADDCQALADALAPKLPTTSGGTAPTAASIQSALSTGTTLEVQAIAQALIKPLATATQAQVSAATVAEMLYCLDGQVRTGPIPPQSAIPANGMVLCSEAGTINRGGLVDEVTGVAVGSSNFPQTASVTIPGTPAEFYLIFTRVEIGNGETIQANTQIVTGGQQISYTPADGETGRVVVHYIRICG